MHEEPEPRQSAPAVEEHDAALSDEVREQLDRFHQYLASLDAQNEIDRVQPPERLLSYSEIDKLVRWRVTLTPVRNLRAAARFRAALAQLPLAIGAQACDISADALQFSLTTVHLSMEEVRARVEAALRAIGYQGIVDVEPRV